MNRKLIALLALMMLGMVALVSAGAQSIPPRVVEIIPPEGAELALEQEIILYFDQAMERASVEAALQLESDLPAETTLDWQDDQTLVISPQDDWPRDAALTVRLDTTATSAEGDALAEAYAARLSVVGFLEVAEVLPRPGSEEIGVDSLITVIFNRPVVPLTTVGEQADLPQPLSISPGVAGQGEWLNTSIYVFTPENGLVGGSLHTVTVEAGLTGTSGGVLAVPYEWQFSTEAPRVVEVRPEATSQEVPLEDEITVRFSQPMDPAATEDAISVRTLPPAGGLERVQALGAAVEAEYEWSEDGRRVTVQPVNLLALGMSYEIFVDAEVARSLTGAPLAENWSSAFTTVPPPFITRTNPEDGRPDANPFGGVQIYFSAPIEPDTIEGKITIEPEPFREYDTFYYDYDNRYSLDFDIEPSTSYTITIAPGIEDPYGNRIDQETVINFTTRPYDPDVNLNVPDFIGLYSAYNENTRVFATHRNISRLDVALYNLDAETVGRLQTDFDVRDNFTPAPADRLRAWSVDVRSPQDVRRYDLLLLSEQGPDGIGNVQCLGAPPPRLMVGDRGIVAPEDPRALRVREQPNLQGAVLGEIPPNTQFDVLDGPLCADGYLWWQIDVAGQDISGWSAEGTPENYFVGVQNRQGTQPETLNAADYPGLDPGFYYLTLEAPETAARDYDPIDHIALVANANIILKYSPDAALAWVTDLETGEPVADVPVEFYDSQYGLLGRLNTNADGLAVLDIPRLSTLYTTLFAAVQSEGRFAFGNSQWSRGLAAWEFDLPAEYEPRARTTYLYSDRPIYRPGQPVYFRGVLRNQDDVTFTVPDNLQSVPVRVYSPEDSIVYEANLPLTPYGTFSDDFTLDDGAALGFYRLAVELTPGEWRDTYSLGFNVAEYVAPEFQVNVTPAQDEVIQGDDIEVLVEADYFFGGAVSDARIEWSVLGEPYDFRPEGFGRYSFTDFDFDAGPGARFGSFGQEIASGEDTTDAAGEYLIRLPADLGTNSQSQRYTIEARIIDESDQLVAGRATVIVHQGEVYIGLRPESYIGQAGQETGILVQSLTPDGDPVPDQALDYDIVERRWSSVQEEDELGRTVWTWEVEEIPVDEGDLTTDAEGAGRIIFEPPNAGTYKIYATARDERGNLVRAAAFHWVSGREYVAWRQQNSNRFDLITDADRYNVGDTAEILIASPFQGDTTALVTVERGDILQSEVITLESNSAVYELPITPQHAPNIFVSVVIMQGVDENNPYAQFRMGLAMLEVDTERLIMNVDVTPNLAPDEFAGPGDEVTYTIRTTDWQGDPVSAEVGLSVTDLSVLSIAAPNSGTLLDHFYASRGLSVRTSASLSVSVDRVTQTIIDTIKGGGGGGAEAGIFDIREEFVDTPGWEPTLVTDENGEAEYTLTLPDNLTTWRLDARAITRGSADAPMLVGQTTTDLLSTKPLLVRPLTPRFFVVDDVATLGAIVNNNTGEDVQAEVFIQGTGFEALPGVELSQTVDIPAGGRQRVDWQVRILDVPQVDLTFFADGNDGQFTDATRPTAAPFDDDLLPVYRYSAPETVGTAGVMPESGTRGEIIALPRSIDVSRGELTVRVDRSLASAMLQSLRAYTYRPDVDYSTPGIVSRFLPNLYTQRALNDLNLQDAGMQAELDEALNFALQRLYAQQRMDGGWGWYRQSRTDPMITAYVLIGLSAARDNGYTLDPRVIGSAQEYLIGQATDYTPNAPVWRANRQAFYLYALTFSGADANLPSLASALAEQRARLSTEAQVYLALTLHKLNANDERLPAFLSGFTESAILSATGAHWEDDPDPRTWTTDTRSTALVLQALVTLAPENQLVPNVVRWLMVAREGDVWQTPLETTWAVAALTEWMRVSGELNPDYDFSVTLNAENLLQAEAAPETTTTQDVLTIAVDDLNADSNRLSFTRGDGPGNLYYTAHLEAYLPVPTIDALSRGILINRRYYALDDDDERPITAAEVGQEIGVVLTIIAPNDLYYVTVRDPIPAGAQAVNPNLLTTSILEAGPDLTRPLSRGWGWWSFERTEFRDEQVEMSAQFLPRGTYEYRYTLRMGLAGEYNVMPPTANEDFFPEVYGRGEGLRFTIQPAEAVDEE